MSSKAAAAAPLSEEHKYVAILSKRLRALKKRLRSIEESKTAQAEGQKLNPDQTRSLLDEPVVLASIAELEKIRSLLSEALQQDEQSRASSPAPEVPAATPELVEVAPEPVQATPEPEPEPVASTPEPESSSSSSSSSSSEPAIDWDARLRQLLRLVHLGRLLDVSDPFHQEHRARILDFFNDTVTEADLQAIVQLKTLVDGSIPASELKPNEIFSRSVQHAYQFLDQHQDHLIPSISYQRVSMIIDGLAPFFVVPEEESQEVAEEEEQEAAQEEEQYQEEEHVEEEQAVEESAEADVAAVSAEVDASSSEAAPAAQGQSRRGGRGRGRGQRRGRGGADGAPRTERAPRGDRPPRDNKEQRENRGPRDENGQTRGRGRGRGRGGARQPAQPVTVVAASAPISLPAGRPNPTLSTVNTGVKNFASLLK